MKALFLYFTRLHNDLQSYFYTPHFLKGQLSSRTVFVLFFLIFCFVHYVSSSFAGNAALSWNANTEPDLSGYKVYYGTSSGNYGAPIDVGNTTNHTITGLADGTYYFAVTARDTSGNESGFSNEASKALSTPDTTAPVISAITAGSITASGASISWSTNEASDTQIQYGTTTSYGSSTTLNTSMVTSHSGVLSALSASSLYHYRVLSRDAAGNLTTSGDNTFTTAAAPDTTPPAISNISSGSLSTTGATITWFTNEAATTRIEYGTTTAYGSFTSLNSSLVTSHNQSLTGLAPATTYHFRVLSKDASNNQATSGNNTFTTLTPPDTTAPVVSNITASNITAINATITWTTNEGATSRVEYGTTTAYGSSSTSSTLALSHSRTLTGLSNATLYHYRVLSQDAAGNTRTSGDGVFTTSTVPDTTAPVISGISASGITASGATIAWTTDEGATSQVEYGTTTAYGGASALSTTLLTQHSQTLSDLNPSTVVHYRVISKDAANNTRTSSDQTFTTTVASDATAPAIMNAAVQDITANSATVTWTTDEPATSQVEFGQTSAYGVNTTKNETLLTNHQQVILGLSEGTTYHFRIKSIDGSGNTAASGDASFSTSPSETVDSTPPGDITQFAASGGNGQIVLSWLNPSDSDFAGVRIRYRTDHFPTDINDGTPFGDISGEPEAEMRVTHSNLSEGVTYYYLASSYDDSGNFQTTVFVSGTTLKTSSDTASSGGGGCGMIRPGNGEPPRPGDDAAMLSLITLMLLALVKKHLAQPKIRRTPLM